MFRGGSWGPMALSKSVMCIQIHIYQLFYAVCFDILFPNYSILINQKILLYSFKYVKYTFTCNTLLIFNSFQRIFIHSSGSHFILCILITWNEYRNRLGDPISNVRFTKSRTDRESMDILNKFLEDSGGTDLENLLGMPLKLQ